MNLTSEQYADIDYCGHHISVVPRYDEDYPGFLVFVDGKNAMTAFGSVGYATSVAKEMLDKFGERLRPGWGIWWHVMDDGTGNNERQLWWHGVDND